MKLHSLEIENFRAIKHIELDFTDELSRPRLMTLIVGPNGSGKTSIFDAIDIVVKTAEDGQNPHLRDGLILSPQQIIRGIGCHSKIGFEYSLNENEEKSITKVYSKMGFPISEQLEKGKKFAVKDSYKIRWSFPSKNFNQYPCDIDNESPDLIYCLGARGVAQKAIARNLESSNIFDEIGGICYLDQRRIVSLDKSISNSKEENLALDDVLSRLYFYYKKHIIWNEEKYGESYWKRIQRLFNKICYPSEFIGLESGPDSDTLILRKNGFDYDLCQMSSGEHQILRILIGLASALAKNSIVLIDEIELNLHPTWQKRLIRALRDDTDNNQYIVTTHSPDVIGLFYDSEIIHLGDLLE
jgi:predicted ATPase